MAIEIDARVRQKVGTEAQWLLNTLPLLDGECAVVRRADGMPVNLKFGDGGKTFAQLPYFIQYDQGAYISYVATPTQPVAYTIVGGGTYGSITVGDDRLAVLGWNGSTWSKNVDIALPIQEGTNILEYELIPKGRAVERYALSKEQAGVSSVENGQNVIDFITDSLPTDTNIFTLTSFYHKTTGVVSSGAEFIRSKSLIPVMGGVSYNYSFWLYGNAGVVFFNSTGGVVTSISTTSATVVNVTGNINLPSNVVSMGFSHRSASPLSSVFFTSTESKEVVTPILFATPDLVEDEITNSENAIKNSIGYSQAESKYKDKPFLTYDSFEKFGFEIFLAGENMFSFLSPVNPNDTSLWGNGYLRNTGVITSDANWVHSVNNYSLPSGTYNTNLYYTGNSYMWVVDSNGNMIRPLQGGGSGGTIVWSFTINNEVGEYGIKIGINKTTVTLGVQFYVKPTVDIYISPDSGITDGQLKVFEKQIIEKQHPISITRPIITFISDDGSIYNDWFIEALDVYGWKATFAIITGRLGNDYPEFYSKEQVVQNLLEKGHEVAGHTVTHNASAQLATLTESQLQQEIGFCKMTLLSIDDRIDANNFVSPFGSRTVTVDRVVRQYFEANYVTRADADIATGLAINQPPIDNYFMKRVSFDVNSPTSGAMDISRIAVAKQAVDKVVSDGGWLVFAIHPHYEQYMNPDNTVDSRQELRDLLAYINGLNIPVLTANQARKHYKNYSIGNYRLDTSYYERGVNGSEIGNFL